MIEKLYLNAGQMKAGTTFLYGLIKNHPSVYFTPEKELNFLSQHFGTFKLLGDEQRLKKAESLMRSNRATYRDIKQLKNRLNWLLSYLNEPSDLGWYEKLFEGIKPGQYAADFSNLTCTVETDGLSAMQSVMPNVWITYCIRDPIDRAFSHLKFHLKFAGAEKAIGDHSLLDLRRILRSENVRPQSNTLAHVENLLDAYGSERVRILKCESLWADPQFALDNLSAFLGILPMKIQDRWRRPLNVGPQADLTPELKEAIGIDLKPEIEGTYECLEKYKDLLLTR